MSSSLDSVASRVNALVFEAKSTGFESQSEHQLRCRYIYQAGSKYD
ncbi:unnamed protein product [Schistosoma margrebowiei]|uniref:Uncharacterized protein n=1 Tax=Schistosoma margrebowiei TaxID=48269 RepID=A0A183LKT1_9TREM|nr:unnamed protein product [Schistosoma margrebowiei]